MTTHAISSTKEPDMKFEQAVIHQGDVALIRISGDIPASAKPLSHLTLALGEATGHHHSLVPGSRATLFRPDDMTAGGYLRVEEETSLAHQEHDTLTVPAGLYVVAVQVEETPDVVKVVAD